MLALFLGSQPMVSLFQGRRALPPELVAFIEAADVVFRSQDDEAGPRPLIWNLIEPRPIYADQPDKLRERIAKHFKLSDKQMRRAITLINARVADRQSGRARPHALDGIDRKRRRTWVNSWSAKPWDL